MGKSLIGKELGKGLRQRKDGRYEARAQINGVSIHIVATSLKDVRDRFADAKKEAEKKVDYRKSDMTLDDWFAEWFSRYKEPKSKSKASITAMKQSYKNTFGIYLGKRKISEITCDDVQDVINAQKAHGKADSTIRNGLSLLQQSFESAVRNLYVPVNPCYGLCVSWENDGNKRLSRFLTVDEQRKFLNEVDDSWYKELFHVMFDTGMRIGEVGGLKWEDVDFKNHCISIVRSLSCTYDDGERKIFMNTPKTSNSVRCIPFMGDCEQMLKSQQKKQQKLREKIKDRWRGSGELDDLVFTTTLGSPATKYVVAREINNATKTINLEEEIEAKIERRDPVYFERMYPHAIRHTFCCRCFESGMNPKVVQGLMGHAHYSTTIDIYTHVTDDMMKRETSKFSADDPNFKALTQV